jgi:hypothetical protein
MSKSKFLSVTEDLPYFDGLEIIIELDVRLSILFDGKALAGSKAERTG